jgi:hypothetical protein
MTFISYTMKAWEVARSHLTRLRKRDSQSKAEREPPRVGWAAVRQRRESGPGRATGTAVGRTGERGEGTREREQENERERVRRREKEAGKER